ncbi:MAG: hypothetical protein HZB99_03800 [Candidatus Harrisonbacteria bacterium]|nr:hypothetical protein [Candidatus Harrisonbacteria bacterium]
METLNKASIVKVWKRGIQFASTLGRAWEHEEEWWTDKHHDLHAIFTIVEDRYGNRNHRREVRFDISWSLVCYCPWTLRIQFDGETVFEAYEIRDSDIERERREASLQNRKLPMIIRLPSGGQIKVKYYYPGPWECFIYPKKIKKGKRLWKLREKEWKKISGKDSIYVGPPTRRMMYFRG